MAFYEILSMTVLSTLQIFIIGAVGFFLVRIKVMDENGLRLFSRLVVSLFFPLFSFHQLVSHFSFARYPNWWVFPLISFGITLSGFFLGWLFRLSPKASFKKEFIALVGFQNSGFLPLLLAATMFAGDRAQQLYIQIFLFLIGFDLTMWSFGVWFLTRHKVGGFHIKSLLTSPFVAIVTALIFVFFGWNYYIPEAVLKPMKMLGDCALPTAMLLVGGNLAVIDMFSSNKREVLKAAFAKLILLPTLALWLVLAIPVNPAIGFLIILQAAVPSASSLSVIARHYHIDDQFLNQGVFFTTVMSVLTIPFFLSLFMRMASFF